MAYTAVPTIVAGDILTASWGNTYIRDNMAFFKIPLDSSGKITAISSTYFASLSGANLTGIPASAITAGAFPSGNFGFGMSPSYPVDVAGQTRGQGFLTNTFTLANNAVAQLCQTASPDGMVLIKFQFSFAGIYALQGSSHTTDEVLDPFNTFTTVSGTAAKFNVYWSGGNSRYEIENKIGSSVTVYATLIGTP